MATVDLEHVDKVYPNGVRAVDDCTLHVDDGELLVLVGPSGSGKSTVMRLVAGLEEVTAGTLRIGGTVVNALTPQARNVAMVFQDYALYPQMTVRRNLEFPLRMRALARADIDAKVARVAALLGLEPLLDRLPRQLSGGQRQRVAMGRALVREPAVSLLDEPLSNLDAKLRVQVRAEIGELQRRIGTTMLYVTHDQVEAMTLGDRVAVMDRGRLQQVATPRDLYDRPTNAFVAGFMGNPPMNLVPARVRAGDPPTVAVAGRTIALAGATLPRQLAAVDDRSLTVGIRPEHLRLAESASGAALPVIVEHVEWLGHETLVYVRMADAAAADAVRLVARVPGMQALAKDDSASLRLDAAELRFFDADGAALA
jgi:multiple sugar transport system ATP-binding protein